MRQIALLEAIEIKLQALPPTKLEVVLDFVSYLAERDPDQAWFWTAEWQAAEQKADEDLQNGDYEDFDTMDDFIASLNNEVVAS